MYIWYELVLKIYLNILIWLKIGMFIIKCFFLFGVKFVYLVILFRVVILFVRIIMWGKKLIFWSVGIVILKIV